MNTSDFLRKYIYKRHDTVMSVLFGDRRLSIHDFHVLRVELKKMKAAFTLIQFCAPNFERKKIFLPWRSLFRQAGRIRELQLDLGLMRQLSRQGSLMPLTDELRDRLAGEKESFRNMADARRKRQLQRNIKVTDGFLKKVTHKKVISFLKYKRKMIRILLEKKDIRESEVHALRQRLKEYYYILRLFDVRDLAFRRMGNFQDVLGKWHDLAVMKAHLTRSLRSGQLSEEEYAKVKVFRKKIAERAKPMLEQILSKRKHLM